MGYTTGGQSAGGESIPNHREVTATAPRDPQEGSMIENVGDF